MPGRRSAPRPSGRRRGARPSPVARPGRAFAGEGAGSSWAPSLVGGRAWAAGERGPAAQLWGRVEPSRPAQTIGLTRRYLPLASRGTRRVRLTCSGHGQGIGRTVARAGVAAPAELATAAAATAARHVM